MHDCILYYYMYYRLLRTNIILLIKLSLTIDILEKNYGSVDIRTETINTAIYKAYKCSNASKYRKKGYILL